MTKETHIKGRRLILYGEKDGVMKRLCGSRTFNISTSAEILKATKPSTGRSTSNYYGDMSYSLTTGGLCSLDTGENITHRDLMKMQYDKVSLFWVGRDLDHHDEFYAGTVLIQNVSVDANYDDMMMYNASCMNDGDLIFINPYELHLVGTKINGSNGVMGVKDQEKMALVARYVTGGLPPIKN